MRKRLSVAYLKRLNACPEAIVAFEAQPERDTLKILDLLLEQNKVDWANWLVTRLLNQDNQARYAKHAAERAADYAAAVRLAAAAVADWADWAAERAAAVAACAGKDYVAALAELVRYGIRLLKKQEGE